jgi:hypothetical protein
MLGTVRDRDPIPKEMFTETQSNVPTHGVKGGERRLCERQMGAKDQFIYQFAPSGI